jgi:tyrosyl-tRNA synthetase
VDAERVIKAGGVYVNFHRNTNADAVFVPGEHILPNGITLLRVGKKNYYVVRWLGSL